MARTLSAIKALVEAHTGRTKDSLETALADSALKLATMAHPFRDTHSTPSDFTITEDAWEVDISSVSPMHILTARIVDADGPRNANLILKPQEWWDEKIVNPEDNTKGWPTYGLWRGTNIVLDRPAESGLELRIRISTVPTFTNDSTACPIDVLDLFVESYMTAGVFKSLTNMEKYAFWKRDALGPEFDRGKIGGELLQAIRADQKRVSANMEGDVTVTNEGLAVKNLITDHPRYGETHLWHRV